MNKEKVDRGIIIATQPKYNQSKHKINTKYDNHVLVNTLTTYLLLVTTVNFYLIAVLHLAAEAYAAREISPVFGFLLGRFPASTKRELSLPSTTKYINK
jgi:hypothetical protein